MNNYKITNITNTLTKRDIRYNTQVSIDIIDEMINKPLIINAGDTIYLKIKGTLPLSIHSLRAKKMITVVEVSDNEVNMKSKNVTSKPKTIDSVSVDDEKKNVIVAKSKLSKKNKDDAPDTE